MRTLKLALVSVILITAVVPAATARAENLQPRRLSQEQARALAIYAPKPRYSSDARLNGMTGAGVILLTIDRASGRVAAAQIERSIGQKPLDDEALAAFRKWRFKPHTASKVRIPIRFTMGPFGVYVRALGDTSWVSNATYWFLPGYPRQAILSGLTGRGKAILKIDPRSGSVMSATMLESTGHQILDGAAIRAFRQWHFKPGTLTTLQVPIEFASGDK